MKRLKATNPTFCDITWGAGGSTADLTLDIAKRMQQEVGVECMMHLTCTNMEKDMVDKALAECKAAGIRNILALRGDPPKGQEKWTAVEGGFECGLDLVKYIRSQYGDYFGIAVAGYPEAHPEVIVEDAAEMVRKVISEREGEGERERQREIERERQREREEEPSRFSSPSFTDMGRQRACYEADTSTHLRHDDVLPGHFPGGELPEGLGVPEGEGRRRRGLHRDAALLRRASV